MGSSSPRLAPLLLRLGLGATFLWAGFGKIYADEGVKGPAAAVLANMGVITPADAAKPPAADKPAETKPADKPATKPADSPRPAPTEPLPEEPATKPKGAPPALVALASPAQTRTYSADDFPDEVRVRRVYMLSLGLHFAAHPAPKADGKPAMPLWPVFAGEGKWPVYLAWAVAITEVAGGFFVLAGFLTRLAALGIAGVMAGAMWLTEIGPAIQSGKAWLGFLPDHPAFVGFESASGTYAHLLWQFALFTMALAIAGLGSGALSIDGLLFGKAPAPKPPPPKPAA
jgi:uncharacterized membrane protein YphA (DoxX/SURF4 family)